MRGRLLALVTSVLTLAACHSRLEDTDPPLVAPLVDPSGAEAAGIVALVNDASTTFEILDDDVALDRRAAQNLVDRRPFADLDEIDRVPYVGTVALQKLLDYALAGGWVVRDATDADTATLALVNDPATTFELLDVDVALDRRAAQNIIDERPFESIEELDAVSYVGPSALGRLETYALAHGYGADAGPAGEGEACVSGGCAGELVCQGIPRDGSGDTGKCVDRARVSGEGDRCDRWAPCADRLICAGWTLWGEGSCVPQWMAGRFSSEPGLTVASGGLVEAAMVVSGLASVPVDIEVTARIEHPRLSDLRVTLVDPNGDEAVLWDRTSELDEWSRSFVTTGISRDDEVNGAWTLRVEDTATGETGVLREWNLFIVSRWD